MCRYVDIPLQHIHDEVLKRMRRETDGRYIRDLLSRMRSGIPGLAVRTTFIVGFPGETEEQFQELLGFIESARFERLGIFAYSKEDHTSAGDMTRQVSTKVKKDRHHRAMSLQQEVSRDVQREFVGRTLRVLVEKPDGNGGWVGRTHADAPEIDGSIVFKGVATAGEFSTVRVTGASEYDLTGEAVAGT
jgi:ribosomal protein S12 methylthiotransferase